MNTTVDFLFRLCLSFGIAVVGLIFGLICYTSIYLAVMLYTIVVGGLVR